MGLYFKKLNGDNDRIKVCYSSTGSDYSEPEAEEASSNTKEIRAVGQYVGEAGGNERHKDSEL